MATREEKHAKKADALLKSLMKHGTRLDGALYEYHTKYKGGQSGLVCVTTSPSPSSWISAIKTCPQAGFGAVDSSTVM